MRGIRDVAKRSWTRLNFMFTSLDSGFFLRGLFENASFDRFAGNTYDLNETGTRLCIFLLSCE